MKQLGELGQGDVLFLSGSSPSSMQDDAYQKIMAMLDGRGVRIAVDATRDLLMKVLPYHPFLIKPNNHELGEIFGVELKDRQSVIPYGKKLQEMGAVNVLISMAGEGAVLIAENGDVYEEPAPKGKLINGVGAGDSMVAGFMAGYMEKQDYEYAFHHLVGTLEELREALGNRKMTLCRELTKKHETAFLTTIDDLLAYYKDSKPLGECVLVIQGRSRKEMEKEAQESWEEISIEDHMELYEKQGMPRKEAMKQVAKDRGVTKREIYKYLIQ